MSRINKILKTIDFIEYISKPMEKKDISLILKINNVSVEKSELMLDFIDSIFSKVINTYMGDDLMSDEDQKNHFIWCWDSVLKDFRREFIYFDKKGSLYDYFHTFIMETFYKEPNKNEKDVDNTLYFIKNGFNYSKIKTKSEIDNFLDLYKIFNKSFTVSI
jgi:hypothetical protein